MSVLEELCDDIHMFSLISCTCILVWCHLCVLGNHNNITSLDKQEYCVMTSDIMIVFTLSLKHQQYHVISQIILDITDVGRLSEILKF